jgi:hypothetical protein
MPWFSLSSASVCLSVTYLSSLPDTANLVSVSSSNSPCADHVTFIVGEPLEGTSRFVPHPTHDPAFFVYVFFLGRQAAQVAYEFFTHYLTIFVEGCLDDVTQLVDCTPRVSMLSVCAFSLVGGKVRGFFRASSILAVLLRRLLLPATSSFRSLVNRLFCLILCLSYLISTLTYGVLGALRRVARLLRGLPCNVAGTFSHVARSIADSLCRLASTLSGRLRGLARPLAYFASGLTSAFAHLLGSLTGSLTDILYRRLGP